MTPDDPNFYSSSDDGDEDIPEFKLSQELEEVERQIRIQHLREELEKRGNHWEFEDPGDLTSAAEEAMLDRMLFYETAPRTTYAKMLIEDGISLPCPDNLRHESQLRCKVWEVIFGLARRRVFLYCTNHLSNRALYSQLWYECLNIETVDISEDPESACHIDLLGDGSDEETALWLKYYADDEERHWWRSILEKEGKTVPEAAIPPYDRDRHLPQREDY